MIINPKDEKLNWLGLIINIIVIIFLGYVLYGWFKG